jgi:integrase
MVASRVINQQSFQDGKLVLYQLENRPRKLWLCRIKVPNGTGYIYRGTGTSDFYEARKFAENTLDDIKIKTKLGQSITGPSFAKMVEEFETQSKVKGETTKRNLAIVAFLKTYAVPYFTKSKITDISAKEIAKFFDWRRANSKRKTPKETTILHETSQFTTFLRWCHQRGHLDREIHIQRPKQDGVRRPHFNAADIPISRTRLVFALLDPPRIAGCDRHREL